MNMGVWIYLLILTAVVAGEGAVIYVLIRVTMSTRTNEIIKDALILLKEFDARLDKAEERLQNIESWNELAVIWMKGQKKRTTRNTVDIAALKLKSVFADPDPETEADDLFKEAEDCTKQS